MRVLPTICPSCDKRLKVKELLCENCGTEVEGVYELPVLASLSASDQQFVLQFIKVSGSLKEMAKHLGLSYPTVRNRLDDIINRINELEKNQNNSTKKEGQNESGNSD
jgi:hypothetical protein